MPKVATTYPPGLPALLVYLLSWFTYSRSSPTEYTLRQPYFWIPRNAETVRPWRQPVFVSGREGSTAQSDRHGDGGGMQRSGEQRATTGIACRQAVGWAGLRHARKNSSVLWHRTPPRTTDHHGTGCKTPLCHQFPTSSPSIRGDSHF